MRECTKCRQTLPLESFPWDRKRNAYNAWCKPCRAADQRARYARDPKKHMGRTSSAARKRYDLRVKYGITQADYDRMFLAQAGVCAICRQPETRVDRRSNEIKALAVDHCHSTGKVRGLLCSACNQGIGVFREDAVRLEAAAAYVRLF